jgi:AcrR family transcriptional regulator
MEQRAPELLWTRGFDQVTVEGVCPAAGVAPTTVYRPFGTKEEVVFAHWEGSEGTPTGDGRRCRGAGAGPVADVLIDGRAGCQRQDDGKPGGSSSVECLRAPVT